MHTSTSVGVQGAVTEEIRFVGSGRGQGGICVSSRKTAPLLKGGAVNLRGSVGNLDSPAQVPMHTPPCMHMH